MAGMVQGCHSWILPSPSAQEGKEPPLPSSLLLSQPPRSAFWVPKHSCRSVTFHLHPLPIPTQPWAQRPPFLFYNRLAAPSPGLPYMLLRTSFSESAALPQLLGTERVLWGEAPSWEGLLHKPGRLFLSDSHLAEHVCPQSPAFLPGLISRTHLAAVSFMPHRQHAMETQHPASDCAGSYPIHLCARHKCEHLKCVNSCESHNNPHTN